ncbi:hypothetical protein CC80DRAFT_562813, partial [Byssothecium circinans]
SQARLKRGWECGEERACDLTLIIAQPPQFHALAIISLVLRTSLPPLWGNKWAVRIQLSVGIRHGFCLGYGTSESAVGCGCRRGRCFETLGPGAFTIGWPAHERVRTAWSYRADVVPLLGLIVEEGLTLGKVWRWYWRLL